MHNLDGIKGVINKIKVKPSVSPIEVKNKIIEEFKRNALIEAMNSMLAAEGYSWVIVPVSERKLYTNSLEIAGTYNNIIPFANLLAEQASRKS